MCNFHLAFFSMHFVSISVVHAYSSINTDTAWKKSYFDLSERSDFHMLDNSSIAVHTFAIRMLTSLSVDETLLPRYVNLSTNFRCSQHRVEIAPTCLKHTHSILFVFTWRSVPSAVCSRLSSRDSAWAGVFPRSAI